MTDLNNSQIVLRGLLGGTANAITMVFTNPLDVLKIRFQTAGDMQKIPITQRTSMWSAAKIIISNEGPTALFKGLSISMLRELTFSSARLGLYEPMKKVLSPTGSEKQLSLGSKIFAGMSTGAIASCLFTPTDVLKGIQSCHSWQ